MPLGPGTLDEREGRLLFSVVDSLVFLTNVNVIQSVVMNHPGDASQLRQQNLAAAASLMAQSYTYWNSTPAGPPGVYNMLRDRTKVAPTAAVGAGLMGRQATGTGRDRQNEQRVELYSAVCEHTKYWLSARVRSTFWMMETPAPDGCTVLIDCADRAVYHVHGVSTPLHSLIPPAHTRPLTISLTLLPWFGKIVFDGFLTAGPPPPGSSPNGSKELKDELDGVVSESGGRAITSLYLPTLLDCPVKLRSLVSRPELNGLSGTAAEWDRVKCRYKILLDDKEANEGRPVSVKPACAVVLVELSPPSAQMSEAGADAGNAEPLTEIQTNVRDALGDASIIEDGFWVFRRFGYSQSTNPENALMIVDQSGQPVSASSALGGDPRILCAHLEPSVDEILAGMHRAIVNSGGRKPQMMAVDSNMLLQNLRRVLEGCQIECGFYPPPSTEEQYFQSHAFQDR